MRRIATEPEDWKAVPPESRIRARLLDGRMIEYSELKPGNIFQAVLPGGTIIDPEDTLDDATCIPDHETFAVCTDEPVRGWCGNPGWAVPIETGTRDEMIELSIRMLAKTY